MKVIELKKSGLRLGIEASDWAVQEDAEKAVGMLESELHYYSASLPEKLLKATGDYLRNLYGIDEVGYSALFDIYTGQAMADAMESYAEIDEHATLNIVLLGIDWSAE